MPQPLPARPDPRPAWLPVLGIFLILATGSHPARVRAEAAGPPGVEALATLAGDLVRRAASMRADATRFRIDATLYREGLRDLLLAAERDPATPGPPPALVAAMIRMSALLHAAAECKTGRYIVCPADLMARLEHQQAELDDLLGAAPGGGR